ncbi:MAG: alpha/beta fold hydrolase [Syntrophales bacterium]|nr:alpha/beta fold hydrolase [Syntrophales bacterium]MDD5234279.1 alpha/beta fold hydrolase [Syntrophales bacterium]MDD5531914.1 alpha/beta fold hydrolase [Syntrophales bacterium]HPL64102.1 alpha/beta fold hydrolase [Syntrophales bacterium]
MEQSRTPLRVFIHGLESSSSGNKAVFFKARYPGMLIEDYRGDLRERMEKLEKLLENRKDLILVGSSFGGLMAAIYACRHPEKVRRLILLAPALDLDDFAPCSSVPIEVPTFLFHGGGDDVVPPEPVREIAARVFRKLVYRRVDDDHPLRATFETYDWDGMLEKE